MQYQIINNEPRVITLKEITDILGKRHDKSMKIIDELAKEPTFGTMEKIDIVIKSKNGRANNSIQTYLFTRKQALAVGARLDNTSLMKVINRLEELTIEKQPISDTTQTMQLVLQGLTKVIELVSNNNQETELDKEKKRLEIDNLKIDKIHKIKQLAKDYNLEEIDGLNHIPSELKPQLKKLTGSVVKEIRPAINGISPTECLKTSELSIRPTDFYIMLNKLGIIEKYEYPDYLKGTITKWKLSAIGRYYGYNQHSSSIKELPYQVKLYPDRFHELLTLLRNEGYID